MILSDLFCFIVVSPSPCCALEMSDLRMGIPSLGEAVDDSQLTIRIPNPKVFMARQSQWKGRRGKPRCDHCRLNNLKVGPKFSLFRVV